MKKIFSLNGGQKFAHSGGAFNEILTDLDQQFFTKERGFEHQVTHIDQGYQAQQEVEKYVWADVIIYHFPMWWFSMPFKMKKYIDEVFTAGHRAGMYYSDGRKQANPAINYGKGGALDGRKYLATTSWNAPETAFTLPDEFFQQKSVDDGVLFGFHRMNAFLSLEKIQGIHFHDLEKNVTDQQIRQYKEQYMQFLAHTFST